MFDRILSYRIITVACALFALSACSSTEKVSYKSGGMTHTWAEGKAAVPKEFEKLVYPEASTTGSVSADGDNDEQSKFLMLTSTKSTEEVSQWYQDQLKNSEWKVDKVEVITETPKLISISGHKADLEMNVMIAEEGAKTTISMSAGKSLDENNENKEPSENYTPDKVTPPGD
jgi:hypothetical protein